MRDKVHTNWSRGSLEPDLMMLLRQVLLALFPLIALRRATAKASAGASRRRWGLAVVAPLSHVRVRAGVFLIGDAFDPVDPERRVIVRLLPLVLVAVGVRLIGGALGRMYLTRLALCMFASWEACPCGGSFPLVLSVIGAPLHR